MFVVIQKNKNMYYICYVCLKKKYYYVVGIIEKYYYVVGIIEKDKYNLFFF